MRAKEIIDTISKEDLLNLWFHEVMDWADCEGGNGERFITKDFIIKLRNKFKVKYYGNIIKIRRSNA